MDLNVNYYVILKIDIKSSEKDIKKAYYKLSFDYHPDRNKDIDSSKFNSIKEAYDTLINIESRDEYDKKSRFGGSYDEMNELFVVNLNFDYDSENKKFENFKKNTILNIVEEIYPEKFKGSIKYNRWVLCKTCHGSGKDLKSKLIIKDEFGNIKGIFDSDDGCDFCDGQGKDHLSNKCGFCFGQGKIGTKICEDCKGERRILGKQKLSKIILNIDKSETTIKHMGHFSKEEPGKVGNLILKHK